MLIDAFWLDLADEASKPVSDREPRVLAKYFSQAAQARAAGVLSVFESFRVIEYSDLVVRSKVTTSSATDIEVHECRESATVMYDFVADEQIEENVRSSFVYRLITEDGGLRIDWYDNEGIC